MQLHTHKSLYCIAIWATRHPMPLCSVLSATTIEFGNFFFFFFCKSNVKMRSEMCSRFPSTHWLGPKWLRQSLHARWIYMLNEKKKKKRQKKIRLKCEKKRAQETVCWLLDWQLVSFGSSTSFAIDCEMLSTTYIDERHRTYQPPQNYLCKLVLIPSFHSFRVCILPLSLSFSFIWHWSMERKEEEGRGDDGEPLSDNPTPVWCECDCHYRA